MPGHVAGGAPRVACVQSECQRIPQGRNHDGNCRCCFLQGQGIGARSGQYDIGIEPHQFFCGFVQVARRRGKAGHDVEVAVLNVSEVPQSIEKRLGEPQALPLLRRTLQQDAKNGTFVGSLGGGRIGPRRRAAQQPDELAPSHAMPPLKQTAFGDVLLFRWPQSLPHNWHGNQHGLGSPAGPWPRPELF